MPRRKKGSNKEDPHEGAPPASTLGDFLFAKLELAAPPADHDTNQGAAPLDTCDSCEAETVDDGLDKAFYVKRTKKGNIPVSYENRAKGKKVTVIGNVTGNVGALLSELKRASGCGGVARGDSVELQGDHRVSVGKFLKGHPCLHA